MITRTFVPFLGREQAFVHRDRMKKRANFRAFQLPETAIPTTALPVDSTGGQKVSCPMDGNDTYGDCGEAMAAHADNILTFRQGQATQSTFDQAALVKQYLTVSGGDNGLDEDDVVNRIWKVGIGGNAQAIIVDSLDIDVTNIPLAQYAIDQFYTIQMAWSVPNDFIKGFATGSKWLTADRPNPNNGHFTPLADVDANGVMSIFTWGSYGFVGPEFIASVQPQCFVVFSPRQFDPKTGLDSKGRHITTQAAKWVACGGNTIAASVINAFPPLVPTPGPVPVPVPVPGPNPAPSPLAASTGTFDPVAKTLSLPAGWTAYPGPGANGLLVAESISAVYYSKGYTVVPQPFVSPTPAPSPASINWATVISQLLALAPQIQADIQKIISLFNPSTGKPVSAIDWVTVIQKLLAMEPAIQAIVVQIIQILNPTPAGR